MSDEGLVWAHTGHNTSIVSTVSIVSQSALYSGPGLSVTFRPSHSGETWYGSVWLSDACHGCVRFLRLVDSLIYLINLYFSIFPWFSLLRIIFQLWFFSPRSECVILTMGHNRQYFGHNKHSPGWPLRNAVHHTCTVYSGLYRPRVYRSGQSFPGHQPGQISEPRDERTVTITMFGIPGAETVQKSPEWERRRLQSQIRQGGSIPVFHEFSWNYAILCTNEARPSEIIW